MTFPVDKPLGWNAGTAWSDTTALLYTATSAKWQYFQLLGGSDNVSDSAERDMVADGGTGDDVFAISRAGLKLTLSYGNLGNDRWTSFGNLGTHYFVGGFGEDTGNGGAADDFLALSCVLPTKFDPMGLKHTVSTDIATAGRQVLDGRHSLLTSWALRAEVDHYRPAGGTNVVWAAAGRAEATLDPAGWDIVVPALTVPSRHQAQYGSATSGLLNVYGFGGPDRMYFPNAMAAATFGISGDASVTRIALDVDGAGTEYTEETVAVLHGVDAGSFDLGALSIGLTKDRFDFLPFLGVNYGSHLGDDKVVYGGDYSGKSYNLGAGHDQLRYALPPPVPAPAPDTAPVGADIPDQSDQPEQHGATVDGARGSDTIVGGPSGDALRGGSHGDSLDGAEGDDLLFGDRDGAAWFYDLEFGPNEAPGADTIAGGDGDDLIQGGGGADRMTGGTGRDLFIVGDPFWGAATITDFEVGASGDLLVVEGMRPGTSFEFVPVGGDLGLWIDRDGSSAGYAPELAAVLMGVPGSDAALVARADGQAAPVYLPWVHTFYGHLSADDTVAPGDATAARYELFGGNDSLDASTLALPVEAHAGAGADTLKGGAAGDVLSGGSGSDSIDGGAGGDLLAGDGRDLARDSLIRPPVVAVAPEPGGADTIRGGDGDDLIDGGAAVDQVWGGPGVDTFFFDSVDDFGDVIHDFQAGFSGDVIVVERLIRLAPGPGSQRAYFSVVQQGADAHLRVDLDGPGAAFAPQLLAVLEATPAASVALSDIAGQVRIGNEYLENSPPVALDAEISTPRNTPRVGELPLGLDADADEVRFTLDAPAAHGTAEVTRSGLYRYTPDPGYTGADSFGYTVSDYRGSNTYTVEVTVEATNVAPVSADANVAATEDTVFAGALPAATDGDGDPVTYALAVQAAHGVAAVQPDGAFQYTPTADYFGPDAFQFSVSDGNGGSNTYTASVTVAGTVDTLSGTDGADTLVDASGGPSTVDARAGDDTITAGSGDDTIDGGAGIDTATYAGNRSGYDTPLVQGVRQVVAAAGNDGADALVRVERLQFADERRAIDVRLEPGTQDNNAGMTARILGVVFGTDAVAVPAYVGIGLQLLDGGLAYADLCGLAMAAAGATTPAAVVQLLWTNLLGTPPTAAEAQPFVDLLVRGDLSVGQLTALAADLDLNATRIDLAGLQQDGIAYA